MRNTMSLLYFLKLLPLCMRVLTEGVFYNDTDDFKYPYYPCEWTGCFPSWRFDQCERSYMNATKWEWCVRFMSKREYCCPPEDMAPLDLVASQDE
uniref:Secreted protein n=1 Tax=Steinernema glaseri TaxID=37863 RepID=A0A1I7ZPR9_9BILA